MKKIVVFKDYKGDDKVEAVFPEDGNMYPGTVVKVNADGPFTVKWDDPDGGEEESPVIPKNMKYPPIPFDSLEVGQKYVGTVRNILDFGAFVDIGAETEGLVHISSIAKERVDDVHDYQGEGKYGLTMIEGQSGGGGGGGNDDLTPFLDVNP